MLLPITEQRSARSTPGRVGIPTVARHIGWKCRNGRRDGVTPKRRTLVRGPTPPGDGDQSLGTDDSGPQPRPIEEDSAQQAEYPDTDVSLGIAGGHRQARIDCPGAKGR